MDLPATAFALLVGHALADYPLQGDYLARAKSRRDPLGADGVWVHALSAHAVIHGGFVALIMQVSCGLWWLGLCEVVAHWVIDFAKTERRLSYHDDQALHLFCKALWIAIAVGIT